MRAQTSRRGPERSDRRGQRRPSPPRSGCRKVRASLSPPAQPRLPPHPPRVREGRAGRPGGIRFRPGHVADCAGSGPARGTSGRARAQVCPHGLSLFPLYTAWQFVGFLFTGDVHLNSHLWSKNISLYGIASFSFLKDFVYLLERGKGRRKRGRETSMVKDTSVCYCLSHTPY